MSLRCFPRKKNLAANFETLANKLDDNIPPQNKEDFHEFCRAYTDIFSKNVFTEKDYTYKTLKSLKSDDTIAIVPGDKDSCVVVMDKVHYVNKLNEMIEEGIKNGIYEETEDTTLKDLKRFQDFLSRNFKKNDKYTEMYPSSTNQQNCMEQPKLINLIRLTTLQ